MTIDIRRVRPEEYDAAGALTADAYREYGPRGDDEWEAYFRRLANIRDRDQVAPVFVAVEEGILLGTVTLELDQRIPADGPTMQGHPLEPGEAHVRMLAIAPVARRRGIGRLLMKRCADEASKAGKTRLTLNTGDQMEPAKAMYEALGFDLVDRQEFDDGFCLLTYATDLAAPEPPRS